LDVLLALPFAAFLLMSDAPTEMSAGTAAQPMRLRDLLHPEKLTAIFMVEVVCDKHAWSE